MRPKASTATESGTASTEGPKTRARRKTLAAPATKKSKNDEPKDDIDWTPSLSALLLTRIIEDEKIKNGLYPGPGANQSTAKGGGLTKIDHQFSLFVAVFGDDEDWKPKIAEAQSQDPKKKAAASKLRTYLATKIKNRLNKMATTTRSITQALGQTGAGIRSADEIDMSQKNDFTAVWAKYASNAPWYFEMRDLIAERPNSNPVGLGNGLTEVDSSILYDPKNMDVDNDSDSREDAQIDELADDEHDGSQTGSDSEEATFTQPSRKSKTTTSTSTTQPATTQPNTKTPASAQPTSVPKPVKKTKNEEFASIAKAELDLEALKVQTTFEKTKGTTELKLLREKRKLQEEKVKLEEMKMRNEDKRRKHEFRMAMLHRQFGSGVPNGSMPTSLVPFTPYVPTGTHTPHSDAGPSSGSSWDQSHSSPSPFTRGDEMDLDAFPSSSRSSPSPFLGNGEMDYDLYSSSSVN
ncbi:hypothetical protein VKT23_000065 [Stygiomarasmius scandens]|uniref:No apical meristem-associated C-terminal domain-containing protein n=1 Tax=Marasmiellus scandens TaxID=2682957 RepID=A0ABR1K313_9AGAR